VWQNYPLKTKANGNLGSRKHLLGEALLARD